MNRSQYGSEHSLATMNETVLVHVKLSTSMIQSVLGAASASAEGSFKLPSSSIASNSAKKASSMFFFLRPIVIFKNYSAGF